jgi:hypothetical protein
MQNSRGGPFGDGSERVGPTGQAQKDIFLFFSNLFLM